MKAETVRSIIAGWKAWKMGFSADLNRTIQIERKALEELARIEELAAEGLRVEQMKGRSDV